MSQHKEKIPITPDTKISQLLDSYPGLEDILIEITPTFKKLKNPVLRKTIARITTVRQAAKVGNVPLGDVINRLRNAAGIAETFEENENASTSHAGVPDWFDESKIVQTLDARSMLERGEHPVNIVLAEVKKLPPGEIYALVTDFVPVPLIEKAEETGAEVWYREDGTVVTSYFKKK